MSSMNRTGKLMLVLALVCGAATIRAEEPKDLSDEKIKALIKDLGDDDFGKRTGAEKDLLRAGAKAMDALKAAQVSADPQVKATAAKLLGKIRLANLPPIDFLDVAPANSIIALQFKNLGTSLELAKKSAIGKLIFSPALDPFRAKLDAALNAKPDAKKKFLLWTERFKGQILFALWELKPPEDVKFGAMLEITDPDPAAVYEDLIKQTGAFEGGAKTTLHKDVEIQQNALGFGPALALVGKNILVGPSVESVMKLVDGVLAPGGVAGTAEFKNAKPKLGTKPEMLLVMDMQAYMKAIMAITPMPGYEETMKAAGMNAKYLFISSACTGESFEDRYVVSNDGVPTGLAAAMIPAADAQPPLNDMAIQPANAVLAGVGYMNGTQMQTALVAYLGGLAKMINQMKAMNPAAAPGDAPDFDAVLKTFETKSGMKVADIAANIKGSIGYYVVLAPGGMPAPPDIGMFITCVDGDKAKALCDAVSKAFEAFDNKGAVKTVDAPNNRKIYQLELTALGMPLQPNFPYTPCWSIEGNRVFIGSSVPALRKQLSYIENKTPGLLTQPDFIKAMGELSADERKGQVVFIDMKSLMTLGATVGLPLLQAQVPDAEIKKLLAALPPASELFKNIPPMMMASTSQGMTATSIIHSPLPPLQSILFFAIGGAMVPMMGVGPGGPVDAPPGGF